MTPAPTNPAGRNFYDALVLPTSVGNVDYTKV
jgi:hypothetical protein